MSGKRIITCFVRAKIPYSTKYTNERAIHVLTSISTSFRYLDDKPNVDRHRQSLLMNDVTSTIGTVKRYKSTTKKKKQTQDDESDEDEEDLEELAGDKNAKVITMQISSMRVDAVVKAGIGIARNKAEVALYNSKIRVNGQKVIKKSMQVNIGDMIDLVRGPSPQNPDFLLVSRITILSAVIHNDGYKIKFTRDKSLVIENYEDSWTPVESQ